MDGTIEDALLVPVSINYERLVDGNFVREQLGQPKQMESLGSALKAIWSVLNSNYGMMRIDFNQPFSIKELIKTFHIPSRSPTPEEKEIVSNGTVKPLFKKPKLVSQPSTASLYGTDVVEEKHRKLVDSIARHVIYGKWVLFFGITFNLCRGYLRQSEKCREGKIIYKNSNQFFK